MTIINAIKNFDLMQKHHQVNKFVTNKQLGIEEIVTGKFKEIAIIYQIQEVNNEKGLIVVMPFFKKGHKQKQGQQLTIKGYKSLPIILANITNFLSGFNNKNRLDLSILNVKNKWQDVLPIIENNLFNAFPTQDLKFVKDLTIDLPNNTIDDRDFDHGNSWRNVTFKVNKYQSHEIKMHFKNIKQIVEDDLDLMLNRLQDIVLDYEILPSQVTDLQDLSVSLINEDQSKNIKVLYEIINYDNHHGQLVVKATVQQDKKQKNKYILISGFKTYQQIIDLVGQFYRKFSPSNKFDVANNVSIYNSWQDIFAITKIHAIKATKIDLKIFDLIIIESADDKSLNTKLHDDGFSDDQSHKNIYLKISDVKTPNIVVYFKNIIDQEQFFQNVINKFQQNYRNVSLSDNSKYKKMSPKMFLDTSDPLKHLPYQLKVVEDSTNDNKIMAMDFLEHLTNKKISYAPVNISLQTSYVDDESIEWQVIFSLATKIYSDLMTLRGFKN